MPPVSPKTQVSVMGQQRCRPLHIYHRKKDNGSSFQRQKHCEANGLQKNDLNLKLSTLAKISFRLACQGNSMMGMVLKDGS